MPHQCHSQRPCMTNLFCTTGRPFDVMVSKPAADCSIDAASGEMHITQVLQVQHSGQPPIVIVQPSMQSILCDLWPYPYRTLYDIVRTPLQSASPSLCSQQLYGMLGAQCSLEPRGIWCAAIAAHLCCPMHCCLCCLSLCPPDCLLHCL